jgi:protein-tyrosine-phosphatase
MRKVLCVCGDGGYHSPMMAALLRKSLGERGRGGDFEVTNARCGQGKGNETDIFANRAMEKQYNIRLPVGIANHVRDLGVISIAFELVVCATTESMEALCQICNLDVRGNFAILANAPHGLPYATGIKLADDIAVALVIEKAMNEIAEILTA